MTNFISKSSYFNKNVDAYTAAIDAFQAFLSYYSGEVEFQSISISDDFGFRGMGVHVSVNMKETTPDETLVSEGFVPGSMGEWTTPDKWGYSSKTDYYTHPSYPRVFFYKHFSQNVEIASDSEQAF